MQQIFGQASRIGPNNPFKERVIGGGAFPFTAHGSWLNNGEHLWSYAKPTIETLVDGADLTGHEEKTEQFRAGRCIG